MSLFHHVTFDWLTIESSLERLFAAPARLDALVDHVKELAIFSPSDQAHFDRLGDRTRAQRLLSGLQADGHLRVARRTSEELPTAIDIEKWESTFGVFTSIVLPTTAKERIRAATAALTPAFAAADRVIVLDPALRLDGSSKTKAAEWLCSTAAEAGVKTVHVYCDAYVPHNGTVSRRDTEAAVRAFVEATGVTYPNLNLTWTCVPHDGGFHDRFLSFETARPDTSRHAVTIGSGLAGLWSEATRPTVVARVSDEDFERAYSQLRDKRKASLLWEIESPKRRASRPEAAPESSGVAR